MNSPFEAPYGGRYKDCLFGEAHELKRSTLKSFVRKLVIYLLYTYVISINLMNMQNKFEGARIAGVETKPDGTKDYSHAATLIETSEEERRRDLIERLKIPESIKPGTPAMLFMKLRNAEIQASDPAEATVLKEKMRILSSILNGRELSNDDVYRLLQEEINEEKRYGDTDQGDTNQEYINLREDLQRQLLEPSER